MNREQRRAGMQPTMPGPPKNFQVQTQIMHTEDKVVIQFSQNINNFQMRPDEVDALIEGLKKVKYALLEHMTKAPKNA